MPKPACPICHEPVQRHPHNPSFPFCGARCKLADLGNWLDECYLVTADPAADFEAAERDDPRH